MAKPEYNVSVPIDTASGQTYWHRIGAGFLNRNTGVITILLNSLPIGDKEGKVKMMLFENKEPEDRTPRDRVPATRQQNPPPTNPYDRTGDPSYAEELDDEIPF